MLVLAAIVGSAVTIGVFSWMSGDKGVATVLNRSENVTVQEDSATIKAVDKVLPSVVSIISSQNVRSIFGGIVEQKGGGTGFIISSDGLIVTNRHVVDATSAKYSVITNDGKSHDMEVVAKDPLADLAVVRIKASGLPIVELGDSDKLVLGQRVIAIGNTLGEYYNTVTTGVVSGIGREITALSSGGSPETLSGVIQTDAAINPGNSGGPLVNLAGQVVGINAAIDLQGELVGFAIPINSVKPAIDSALKTGEIVRPKLGIRYINITKDFAALNNLDVTAGALVARGDNASSEPAVEKGGPADLAGIKEGDIITSINGEEITETKSLSSILQEFSPGDSISVKFLRNDKEQTVTVRLGKL